MKTAASIFLFVATFPFAYYLIVLYSAIHFFRIPRAAFNSSWTPPVSNLKPIRGLDPDSYENFASLCRQNYPEFELLFCVGAPTDPAVAIIEKLVRDFPERSIRLIVNSESDAANDKVAKLARLVREARHEVLVINDSDVCVEPDYFRTVVAPLRDPHIGAVTCFYVSTQERTFIEKLQTVGMMSDFFAGILTAWQLDGVKFAIGKTIATTRAKLASFGGYDALINRPADDLLVGRLIAEAGFPVQLLPYSVLTVSDYGSMRELLHKRMRWIVVMRHMRPWGHFGLVFTHGLVWSLAAIAIRPSAFTAVAYLGTYLALRIAMALTIGAWGLKKPGLWKQLPLIVAWDAVAFCIWLISFTRSSIRWRDGQYHIRNGILIPELNSEPRP